MLIFSSKFDWNGSKPTHSVQMLSWPHEAFFWWFIEIKLPSSRKMRRGLHMINGGRSKSIHCIHFILNCGISTQLTQFLWNRSLEKSVRRRLITIPLFTHSSSYVSSRFHRRFIYMSSFPFSHSRFIHNLHVSSEINPLYRFSNVIQPSTTHQPHVYVSTRAEQDRWCMKKESQPEGCARIWKEISW
jgi:hypothetical protein